MTTSEPRCWSWYFIGKTTRADGERGVCTLCEAEAEKAPDQKAMWEKKSEFKRPNSTNNKSHLKTHHNLDRTSEVVEQKIAERQAQKNLKQPKVDDEMGKTTANQQFLDYMLYFADPLYRCEVPIFRALHATCPLSRQTLRTSLVKHSQARLNEAIAKFKNRTVTLAIDAGTIWNRYLCVVAVCYGFTPLTISMAQCEGTVMSIEWVSGEVAKCVEKLRAQQVYAISIVADNASNMQGALPTLPLLAQRCLAHSLQLAVNDGFNTSNLLEKTWDNCKTVMKANKIPEPPLTRWSGKFLALRTLADLNKTWDVSDITPAEYNAFDPLVRALKPYFVATQLLQSDRANLVLAAAIIHTLLTHGKTEPRTPQAKALLNALRARRSLLITDAIVCVCYYHPGTNRGALDPSIRARIEAIVKGPFTTISKSEATIIQQSLELRVNGPFPEAATKQYALGEYVAFWQDADGFAVLGDAVARLATTNPTEASCERAFSITKWAFPPNRSRASEDLVGATVCGTSAVAILLGGPHQAMLSELPDEDEDLGQPDADALMAIKTKLTGAMATELISWWVESTATDGRYTRRARRESQTCAICNEGTEGRLHKSSEWASCDDCGARVCAASGTRECRDWQETWYLFWYEFVPSPNVRRRSCR
jgi:hypothetical protein